MVIKARTVKPSKPVVEIPMEWARADPAALAAFDPATKTCTMNCGPHGLDPRSRKERLFLCDDCDCHAAPHELEGTPAMTEPKNDAITLELPGYLVDMLANWARADATYDKRLRLADGLVLSLLSHLPALAAEGDLAAALNERREAYDAYHAAKPQ